MAFSDKAVEYTERKVAGMYALLDNWAGTMVGYARTHAPWRDRTSHARQGLHSGVDRDGTKLILYLSHGMEYGQYLEEGTGIYGPHKEPFIIKPKTKKALFWPGATHPVKAVLHSGMKPRAIVGPTFDAHIAQIKRSVLDYWEGDST